MRDSSAILQRIQKNAARLKTVHSKGLVIMSGRGMGMRGSIVINARMPDSLWMKIEGPLGIDVATGVFSSESAVVYTPLQNKVFRGSIGAAVKRGLVPNAVDSTNFISGMVGLAVPPGSRLNDVDSVRIDKKEYLLFFSGNERIWVDVKGPVTRWEKRSPAGDLLWLWEAKRFSKKGGLYLPGLIKITTYEPRQQVTILYETITANKAIEKSVFSIRIPEGAETVEL